MAKKKKTPTAPKTNTAVHRDRGPTRRSFKKKQGPPLFLVVVFAFLIVIFVAMLAKEVPEYIAREKEKRIEATVRQQPAPPVEAALTLAEIQAQKKIIDVHEHIGSATLSDRYISVMDELGIGKMCLMGSSNFTLTLDEKMGFTGYDENNEELLQCVLRHPGRFEAWPTLDPKDPDKLTKFKDLVSRGATGLKLYIGHGFLTKENQYMFHTRAMDDPGMLPVYAYCEENYIPVCIHVNPFKGKPGFAEELIAVLTAFPDMKIDCPHFMLSSIQSSRLREYLDTFPNLYTDVSFGDFFMEAGLTRIAKSPEKFKLIFRDYADRFMFASDLVLIDSPRQDNAWIRDQFQSYLDMLTKEKYTSRFIKDKKTGQPQELTGMALPDWIVERILYKNYEEFIARRPKGTKITRKIDWEKMNITPTGRKPGQMFPPPKK